MFLLSLPPATPQCHPRVSIHRPAGCLPYLHIKFGPPSLVPCFCLSGTLPPMCWLRATVSRHEHSPGSVRSSCTELLGMSMLATWLDTPQRSLGRSGSQCPPPLRTKVQAISKAQQARRAWQCWQVSPCAWDPPGAWLMATGLRIKLGGNSTRLASASLQSPALEKKKRDLRLQPIPCSASEWQGKHRNCYMGLALSLQGSL